MDVAMKRKEEANPCPHNLRFLQGDDGTVVITLKSERIRKRVFADDANSWYNMGAGLEGFSQCY
jgi:hypothetical protein